MDASTYLKSLGDNESPYGEVIWNYDTPGNDWLADLLEDYARVKQDERI